MIRTCLRCGEILKYGDGMYEPFVWCPRCGLGAATYKEHCAAAGFDVVEIGDTVLIAPLKVKGSLNEDQNRVAHFRREVERHWPTPAPLDAWAYLVTEVAEVGDALLRTGYRQQPGPHTRSSEREVDLGLELGDAYMMLLTLANLFDLNLSTLLERTIAKVLGTLGERGHPWPFEEDDADDVEVYE